MNKNRVHRSTAFVYVCNFSQFIFHVRHIYTLWIAYCWMLVVNGKWMKICFVILDWRRKETYTTSVISFRCFFCCTLFLCAVNMITCVAYLRRKKKTKSIYVAATMHKTHEILIENDELASVKEFKNFK